MVGWGRCRVCGKVVELRDLQWSKRLRCEACDTCRECEFDREQGRGHFDDHDWRRDGRTNED